MRSSTAAPAPIERAGNADLAFLAIDIGGVPEQFAAVLLLDGTVDERSLGERIAGVPRLRQRLRRAPPGCGRAIWADDPTFDVRAHLHRVRCRAPGDEQALLEMAMTFASATLPRDRPLWRAVIIDGLADDAAAVVVVLHHALADGLGGLAVLERLVDGYPTQPARAFPQPAPAVRRLAADAWRARAHAVPEIPATWRELRAAMAAGGGLRPAPAQRCTLLSRASGPQRTAQAVHADLTVLRRRAHRYGGTVNAMLVAAVSGALGRTLAARGERLDTAAIAVPAAGRSSAAAGALGNAVSPLLIDVTTSGSPAARVRQVTEAVRHGRAQVRGRPPIALLGAAFRVVAALGGYRWYMNHQHRVHTVVSYVRGPEQPMRLCGRQVRTVFPIALSEGGNMTVSFQAFSYAGTLTVTAVADPRRCPDLARLTRTLHDELAALTAADPADPPPPPWPTALSESARAAQAERERQTESR